MSSAGFIKIIESTTDIIIDIDPVHKFKTSCDCTGSSKVPRSKDSGIFNKTYGVLRLLKACGANDVCYYACGALNDFNKTCGALRLIKSLRS